MKIEKGDTTATGNVTTPRFSTNPDEFELMFVARDTDWKP